MQITPDNSGSKFTDSTTYKSFNFHSWKLRYKPHAITDAIFITKGGLLPTVNCFDHTVFKQS
jgi:hypothetical protein